MVRKAVLQDVAETDRSEGRPGPLKQHELAE